MEAQAEEENQTMGDFCFDLDIDEDELDEGF